MKILDIFRGWLLGGIDWLNILTNPFYKFTRDLDAADDTPLPMKAAAAWKDIQDNWMFGPEREFYWHMAPNDMGDMAIWHGCYVASCAFKRDYDALDKALDGLEKLQCLGGNSRLARGAGEIGGPQSSDPSRKYHYDGQYVFTDNCSESSLIGYLFGLWAAWTVCGGYSRERRIAKMLNDLAKQVHWDGEVLRNQDDSEAKFGHLKPGLFTAPIRISALACLYLMAHETGRVLDPSERHLMADVRYRDILDNHMGALTHPETHFLWIHPWYQDMLAYIVLVIQATMAPSDKRPAFRAAMRMQAKKNKHEGNAFYTYMYVLANGVPDFDMIDDAAATLREFNIVKEDAPSCKRPGQAVNSSDDSIEKFWWGWGKRRQQLARQPVPVYRRPPQDVVWQRCPYTLDGTEHARYNSMDFVLAYYMGVYTHMLG